MNDCNLELCLNGGECVDDLMMNYTCVCAQGFDGHNCEIDIDECESSPCMNGGTCVDGVNQYTCICHKGYAGIDCHMYAYCWDEAVLDMQEVDLIMNVASQEECVQLCDEETSFDCVSVNYGVEYDNHGICKLNNESHLTSSDNYHGDMIYQYCIVGPACWYDMAIPRKYVEKIIDSPTLLSLFSESERTRRHSTHEASEQDHPGHDECVQACMQETDFVCRSINFQHGTGSCKLSSQNYHTIHPEKIESNVWNDHCIIDVDECAHSPCLNDGTCVDNFNTYTCKCAPGYMGDRCQTKKWRNDRRCYNVNPRRRGARRRQSKTNWYLPDGVTRAECNPKARDHCCNRNGWCNRHHCNLKTSIVY